MAYKSTGRPRGRPKKSAVAKKKIEADNELHYCQHCGKRIDKKNFFGSKSVFFNEKLPMCKSCIGILYERYYNKYQSNMESYPEKCAVRRICMAFDVYYSDDLFESALKRQRGKDADESLILSYLSICQLIQYNRKRYDDTILEEGGWSIPKIEAPPEVISEKTVKFFGAGFSNEDYAFLQDQYHDWITRHECNTKVQEEIFKQLCFIQLDILKANRENKDTKDLTLTFQKLLESAKLQPKQNSSESISDAQTFGTLIDKWENERPIPEIDPDLKDVDKIGTYIDTFYRGHLCKMMGLKNGYTDLYNNYMKKYTVEKPEYDSDEDSEALFEAVFGKGIMNNE